MDVLAVFHTQKYFRQPAEGEVSLHLRRPFPAQQKPPVTLKPQRRDCVASSSYRCHFEELRDTGSPWAEDCCTR